MSMKNITINIPEIYNDLIQKLVDENIIPSRSEAIRTALREYLPLELDNLNLYGGLLA